MRVAVVGLRAEAVNADFPADSWGAKLSEEPGGSLTGRHTKDSCLCFLRIRVGWLPGYIRIASSCDGPKVS